MITRRQLLGAGVTAVAANPFSSLQLFPSAHASSADPHFFIQIVFQGGWDPSYLFDARPMEMTLAKKIQNYNNKEPQAWTGSNGVSTLVPDYVMKLEPWKKRFSVLRGVLMFPTDGHNENMDYLFSGNPFGGDGFIPHLNKVSAAPSILDYIQQGSAPVFARLTNRSKSISVTAETAKKLVEAVKRNAVMDLDSKAMKFVRERSDVWMQSQGKFSNGVRRYQEGLKRVPEIEKSIATMDLSSVPGDDPQLLISKRDIATALQFFKEGVAHSSIISTFPGADNAHSGDLARLQPEFYTQIVQSLTSTFEMLYGTPYDSTRSFGDVTTVVVSSEFGRTMLQKREKFEVTGTDHNPLSNLVLVGGKGIKGGLVIGGSDQRTVSEKLSGAHKQLDSDFIKVMGLPFDAKTLESTQAMPETYNDLEYLNYGSVINTLYTMFNVPTDHFRVSGRDGPKFPVLHGLLS